MVEEQVKGLFLLPSGDSDSDFPPKTEPILHPHVPPGSTHQHKGNSKETVKSLTR